jgi:pimeloyl-ACP methyl ester carboxylesterase
VVVPDPVERQGQIADLETFWREAPGSSVLYLHGVPTDGADWIPFLERTGGYAPDLPGFGRSAKPSHFDYSIPGYARFLQRFLDATGVGRVSLVMHDWGAVGLALAQAAPERIERLVLIDAVPLLPGYRWHGIARVWRTPLGGEMLMGFTTKWAMRRLMGFTVDRAATPPELVDRVWSHFDHGTQRAILKLYRSSPAGTLAAAGAALDRVDAPALILWGTADPYLPAALAGLYAERLGGDARVELVDGAGHWPWLDRPQLVDTVTDFLRS